VRGIGKSRKGKIVEKEGEGGRGSRTEMRGKKGACGKGGLGRAEKNECGRGGEEGWRSGGVKVGKW